MCYNMQNAVEIEKLNPEENEDSEKTGASEESIKVSEQYGKCECHTIEKVEDKRKNAEESEFKWEEMCHKPSERMSGNCQDLCHGPLLWPPSQCQRCWFSLSCFSLAMTIRRQYLQKMILM